VSTARWTSWVDGPRWAFGPDTIERGAIGWGLHVEDIHEHRRLTTRMVAFTVTGEENRVRGFQRAIAKWVKQMNGDAA
jgi:hypothetical protein